MRDALKLLWALVVIATLTVLAALLGCGGKQEDEDVVALYGPPPVDAGKADACMQVALYGPQPCSTDSDCVTRNGAGWYCDLNNAYPNGCGGSSKWPICVQGVVDAGKPDAGKPDGSCEVVALYGPQPCGSDSDCAARHGVGWYCDKANAYPDGCGGSTVWPVCMPGQTDAGLPDAASSDGGKPDSSCQVVALYGPQQCASDEDCKKFGETGWYCDKSKSYPDGCGGTIKWPSCTYGSPDGGVLDGGPVAPLYGPPQP